MVTRPEAGSIPDAPGSYQFVDAQGRVIYVGKAKSLRSRLSNYFLQPYLLPERTRQMVQAADRVEWIVSANEVEAFFLEFNLIKQHRPRFNIRLKDDKSYPYLAVTLDEEWPRAMVLRGQKRKGVRYFGPYAHAYAIRETLDLLLRTFPIRTCTKAKFDRHHRLGRPCLYAHIEKCAAPCVDAIDHEEYDGLVKELLDFLDGEHDAVLRRLDTRMNDAAQQLEFELAARIRDQLGSVRKAIERQQMVASREEDFDLLGIEEDDLEASIQVFYVRKGRVVGRKGLIVDKVEDVEPPALVARIVEQLYADAPLVPKEILVPVEPEDHDALRGVPLAEPRFEGTNPCAATRRQARADADRERSTRRRRSPATSCAVLPTTTRVPERCSRCKTRSGYPRRPCASSASTSRTCRAPRSSDRWW